MSNRCHECGGLGHMQYRTTTGQRRRYFCRLEHGLQYVARQINRGTRGKYGKYTAENLMNIPGFDLSFWLERL